MKRYNKQGIEKVIEWLQSTEPKCNFCEQCAFGYRFDKIAKQLCENRQLEIQKQHKNWEQKMQKWKDRLKYAK